MKTECNLRLGIKVDKEICEHCEWYNGKECTLEENWERVRKGDW